MTQSTKAVAARSANPTRADAPSPLTEEKSDHTVVPLNDEVPSYLSDTYTWAYLSKLGTQVFDHHASVNVILWGNAARLIRWVTRELEPGMSVMQPAAVYGRLSQEVAKVLGPRGHLEVSDVAPIQVALTKRKLADCINAKVLRLNATTPGRGPFDAVNCFFLLHEVPEDVKSEIVDALLGAVPIGGRVFFVDYHRPQAWHPLRPIMVAVFKYLEPYARALWTRSIQDYATAPESFAWQKDTMFGGMYQRVVATRLR